MTNLAYVFVVGNEKGGAGKTTTSIHLITYLLQLGFKVASIDADIRQQSLSHYLANRKQTAEKQGSNLSFPDHFNLIESKADHISSKTSEEEESFGKLMQELLPNYDFIVVDTPGSNSTLSAIAHSYADTVITPMNDSFVDLDVLAKVSPVDYKVERPAIYSQMIWEQKIRKARRNQGSINWLILRNRLSVMDTRNRRSMTDVLDNLSARLGFQHILGFSERVIYRELFLQGLTLLDLTNDNSPINMTTSHVAARQELRQFMRALNLELINQALERTKPKGKKLDATLPQEDEVAS